MTASTLIFIRHAEKPDHGVAGVDEQGNADDESLTPVGWQRSGALVGLFGAGAGSRLAAFVPDVIFAAGVGEGSRSKRSLETVTPLARMLAPRGVPLITSYLKDDHAVLAADVAQRSGVVLIAWEHKQIPAIATLLAPGAEIPTNWPDRFDLIWVCSRSDGDWTFAQHYQGLLAGDESEPVQ